MSCGNVAEKSLAEITNSEAMITFRQAMLNGNPSRICKACEGCSALVVALVFSPGPGLRNAVGDVITSVLSYSFEPRIINIAKRVTP